MKSLMQLNTATALAQQFGTPLFIYDEARLRQSAQSALNFEAPFGLTVRYAMKANPNRNILRVFSGMGIHIDASSHFEALRALEVGIPGDQILLTSQEAPSVEVLKELHAKGVKYNACSLHQLERYGSTLPGTEISLRFNPGEGSGEFAKTNVGGKQSSFGIWHEKMPEVKTLLDQYKLTVKRIHTHIGAGTDPEAWLKVLEFSLPLLKDFPSATILNMGGGFKVARVPTEKTADLQTISARVATALTKFADETGRQIHLEIEPGTYLTANNGCLLSTIIDTVDTGEDGFEFLKLDLGMTELLRPSYYGAQHTMEVLSRSQKSTTQEYIVVGHCCESGDLLTPTPGSGDEALPRTLTEAEVGDLFVIEGCGAYCSSMSTVHYNSFPEAAEVLLKTDRTFQLIRKREDWRELMRNEIIEA